MAVDANTLALLESIARVAHRSEIDWMIVGASARMMLLDDVYGLPQGRATLDIDIGVLVEDWAEYQRLSDALLADEGFQADKSRQQRFRRGANGILDLVPFGQIEEARNIRWPPEQDIVMSVLGFNEAFASSIEIQVEHLNVRVVSPVGLVLLKFFAWRERRDSHPKKDAADLAYIFNNYLQILTETAIFESYPDIAEAVDYDLDFAAAQVLGQEVGGITNEESRQSLCALLEDELSLGVDSRLVHEMTVHIPVTGEDRVRSLLRQFQVGFELSNRT